MFSFLAFQKRKKDQFLSVFIFIFYRLGIGPTIVNFASVTADLDEIVSTEENAHRLVFSSKVSCVLSLYLLSMLLLWFLKWKKNWFGKKKKILSVNTQQLVNSPHIFKGAAQFRTS